jgi:hypothetical protein
MWRRGIGNVAETGGRVQKSAREPARHTVELERNLATNEQTAVRAKRRHNLLTDAVQGPVEHLAVTGTTTELFTTDESALAGHTNLAGTTIDSTAVPANIVTSSGIPVRSLDLSDAPTISNQADGLAPSIQSDTLAPAHSAFQSDAPAAFQSDAPTAAIYSHAELPTPIVSEPSKPILSHAEPCTPIVSELSKPILSELRMPIVSELSTPILSHAELSIPIVSELSTPIVSEPSKPIYSHAELSTPILSELPKPILSHAEPSTPKQNCKPSRPGIYL